MLWDEQVAAARTSDGRVWAAYALTHIDQTRVYEESCNDEVGCWCNSTTTRDDSWGELVLLELDMSAGEAVEVMRVKTLDVEIHSLFILTRESVRAFDMRAFGTSLALGVRVRAPGDEEFQTPDMRLLRIDTAQIEPAFGR